MSFRSIVKNWFKKGAKPTQQQFEATFDGLRFNDEKVPVKEVDGIDNLLLQKADKEAFEAHKNNLDDHFTKEERIKLAGLSQVTKVSELINDVPFAMVGNPIKKGSFIAFTPKQLGYKMTSVGAIKISVPVPSINFNSCTIYLNVSTNYAALQKDSANIVINCFLFKVGDSVNFIYQNAKIITTSATADFDIHFQNGATPAIYIGNSNTNLRSSYVVISRIMAETNGNLTDSDFINLQDSFTISEEDNLDGVSATLSGNLVQGKHNPIMAIDHLNSPIYDISQGFSVSDDFYLNPLEKKMYLKTRAFELSKGKYYAKEELMTGKVDLLDQTFVVNEVVKNLGFLDLAVDFIFIVPQDAVIEGSFYFSVVCDLIRHPIVGYDLIKFEILNFDNTKSAYLQYLYVTHRLGLTNMNGFKYATKVVTIDCAKPINESYSERLDTRRSYFDYPLSENINTVDNNKIRLNFPNSPFNIDVKTFIKKI